ncbi:hypothetical protein HOM50_01600 [bacterium]|jgi:hypothetical protein|nr:hypothetical protein [bacterium]MBT5015084.1 hypothetical protein [bacterium]
MKKIILLSLILFSSNILLCDSGWSSDEEEPQPLSTQFRLKALKLFGQAREATAQESKYLFLITAQVAIQSGLDHTTVHQQSAKTALAGVQHRIEIAIRRLRLSKANKRTIHEDFLRAARTAEVDTLADQLARQEL